MIRRTIAAIAFRIATAFSAPRGDLKDCQHCGAKNEPTNTRCVTCLQPI